MTGCKGKFDMRMSGEKKAGSRRAVGWMLVLCVLLTLCGCSMDRKVIFTTGFREGEIFRIGNVGCFQPELMVYLSSMQGRYEKNFGEEVWTITRGDQTLAENVKDTVLASIAQMKSMYLLSKEHDIKLEKEEEEKVSLMAKTYFDALGEQGQEYLGITLEDLEQLYTEYYLADKVYQKIIADVNPEISDDEARTILLQTIWIYTWRTDNTGNRVEFTSEERDAAYAEAERIYALVTEPGADFAGIAALESDAEEIIGAYGKGDMDARFETVAFTLEKGQISPITATGDGYCIMKCISTFDRDQTDINKQQIVEQRKLETFGQEYDAFVETLTKRINAKAWEQISLEPGAATNLPDFFAIYAENIGEF